MSKKRVHEIAKELKGHGIELDNKEVVTELVALGYDVKSHSSSLDEDDARAAVQRIVDSKKPKAAPPPVAAKGFVVRRKTADAAPPPVAAPVVAPPPEPEVEAAPPEEPEVAAAPAPEAAAAAPVAAAPATSVPAPAPSAPPAPKISAPRPSAPKMPGAVTIRPAAAAGAPGAPTTPAAPGAPVPLRTVTPVVDPKTLRPTATQAVVLSRPLIAVKRVTPSSVSPRNYPTAPGRKAIGEVKEFKVVSDQLGRGGKEFIDVSKGKEKDVRAKRGRGEKEGVAVTDMREILFGRVALPIRGKKKKPTKKGQKTEITKMADEKKVIKIQEGVTVSELSQRMGVKSSDIIKKLMAGGTIATANQTLDADTAGIIAADHGWKVEKVGFEVEDYLSDVEDKKEDLVRRPPVVTVMGHVDHGKTSLLDAIRSADVAAGEAGGITQHIGAYTVHTAHGDITFIDTPGHAAFSAMRARGANTTDVVVLVVAGDDGVMPQTKEAILQAKAAEVPIVVAINKMDVSGANPDRVKKELADVNVLSEDWGGETIMVPVSARTRQGLDTLLENLAVQAEVLELQANPNKPAVGVVLEARLEKGRGPVATVLVQEGTLKQGDALVSGLEYGRVRMMINDRGETVKELLPGYCAEVVGLSAVPVAGDAFNAVADEKAAREIASHRALKERQAESTKTSKSTLESLLNKMQASDQKELKVLLKADVSGSLEAVAQAVEKLSTRKVKVTIVDKGVGMMTETDVNMAAALKAVIVGFNSRPESGAEAAAKLHGVTLQTYRIIYELLDGVKVMMEGLLEPIRTEKKLGRAEVRQTFNVPKLGTIVGASVMEGTIRRSAVAKLMRANVQIHAGKISSLKRFKDDVREVAQGFECGIGVENYTDFKPGDIIEVFEIEETRPSLD